MEKSYKLYDATEKSLFDKRQICKNLCFEYNGIEFDNTSKKREVLTKIISKIGKNSEIVSPFYCDYGTNIEIGDNFYSNHNLVILDGAKVKIGNNVFIGPNYTFTTAGHPLDFKTRNQGLEYALPITINDNVWIGSNVVILPNVTIGEGSVIGAGSVVTKDIPANVVAVGVPCKVLHKI